MTNPIDLKTPELSVAGLMKKRPTTPITKAFIDKQRKEIDECVIVFAKLRDEVLADIPTIQEQVFRDTWLPLFIDMKEPPIGLWVQEVSGSSNLPVNVVNEAGDVLCTMPPICAPIDTTIVSSKSRFTQMHRIVTEAAARGNVHPTRREELMVDALAPFTQRARTDPKWAAEWQKLCEYFKVPKEKWLVAATHEKVKAGELDEEEAMKIMAIGEAEAAKAEGGMVSSVDSEEIYGDGEEI